MKTTTSPTLVAIYCAFFPPRFLTIFAFFAISPIVANSAPFDYNDDFNNGQRDAWFSIQRDNPNYNATETGGVLQMTKQAGVNSAGVYYRPAFELLGDLSVQVDCSRLSGDTSVGISVSAGTGSVSIYYTTQNGAKVYGSRCGPGGCSSSGQPFPAASAPFRIRRENSSRLVAEYRLNGAWEAMVIEDGATGPARMQLFMIQESGLTAASVATFDNMRIQAPGFVDLRQSITNAPTIQRAIQLCWPSGINQVYQPQWRTNIGGVEIWNTLGGPLVGNGGTECVFDPQGSDPRRFYRVVVIP